MQTEKMKKNQKNEKNEKKVKNPGISHSISHRVSLHCRPCCRLQKTRPGAAQAPPGGILIVY